MTLSLIVNNKKLKKSVCAADGRLPTLEFLHEKIRQLPLRVRDYGDLTIGEVLDQAFETLEVSKKASIEKSYALCSTLYSVGIWIRQPDDGVDAPTYGIVAAPDNLVKAYPALKRNLPQLAGLELHRSALAPSPLIQTSNKYPGAAPQ